jgi:hypothetical protein
MRPVRQGANSGSPLRRLKKATQALKMKVSPTILLILKDRRSEPLGESHDLVENKEYRLFQVLEAIPNTVGKPDRSACGG